MTTITKCFIACAYQFGEHYKDDVAMYTSKYSQRSYNSAGHFFVRQFLENPQMRCSPDKVDLKIT